MNDRLVTVATAANDVEAGIVKNLLEEAGIAAFLGSAAAAATAMPGVVDGVSIQVDDRHAREARRILARRPGMQGGESGPVVRKSRLYRRQSNTPLESALAERPLTPIPSAVAPVTTRATDPDSPTPPRELDAARAFRAAVTGLLLLPLLPFFEAYALHLLFKVWTGQGPLGSAARRKAWFAAAINLTLVAGFVFFVGAIVWYILTPPDGRIDLKALHHPDRMRGVWLRPLPEAEGGGHKQLHLHGDGRMRIRTQSDLPFDSTGTWGYDRDRQCILFRIDRVDQGNWLKQGKLYSMPLLDLSDDELRVDTSTGPVIYRKQPIQ
jgi:hypothetical protein